jgi:hypothetical protein
MIIYHHNRRQWYGGFNDCQTATTLRSDFLANKVLLAFIIGESRECRSGADVQLQQQRVPPAQEGSRAEACFRGALLASLVEDNHSPHIVHDKEVSNSSFAHDILHK